MRLTVAFPVFRDFDGLYFSALDILLHHAEVHNDIEIVVVDNDPAFQFDERQKKPVLQDWVEGYLAQNVRAKYVAAPGPGGPAGTKQRCIDEASGEFVLVMDSHVCIANGGLSRLLDFYAANPTTSDLYSGPIVYDGMVATMGRGDPFKINGTELIGSATHFDPVWRGEMLGIWASDSRAASIDAEPFEIPAMGCGLFTCRKEAFVGFNPAFRGFGGEECYLHEKTRQAGNKAICLPFLRWVHRFARPAGVPYVLRKWDKVRNYVIGHQELGQDIDPIFQHCVRKEKMITEKGWEYLVADPIKHVDEPSCGTCGKKAIAGPIATEITLDHLYEKAKATGNCNTYVPKLREMASQCKKVVELGSYREYGTVALLAGQPETLESYGDSTGIAAADLIERQGKTTYTHKHTNAADELPEFDCDLLFIDDFTFAADPLYNLLSRTAPRVTRWIALHDTNLFGEKYQNGPGVLPAMRRFLRENTKWSVVFHTEENHGFTVLGCLPGDKPSLPSLTKMAWNFAKATATHISSGAHRASDATIDARLETCSTCPQRNGERCTVCGCYLDQGPLGKEIGKVLWQDSFCPIGNWHAEQQEEKP